MSKNKTSLFAYILCCSIIIGAAFTYPKWTKTRTEATLSWDVMGYYLYLPATFIYKDLKQLKFKEDIIKKYQPTGSFYQAYKHPNGNYVMKYPIGLAILLFPFFLIANFIAYIGDYPIDGFSYPYQLMISWGGITMAFIGLWMSRKNLLKYFSDVETAIALLLLVFATNYLNYSAIGSAHTHNFLFTIYAFLIHFSIKWYERPTVKSSIVIGLLIGLATITRPTDIISFLIPVFWGMTKLAKRIEFLKLHWKKLVWTFFTVILVGSIQLIYWKYTASTWLEYSYEDQGFSFLRPHFVDCFFSYRKGWLIYTPVMSFALIGFYYLYKNNSSLFWSTFIFAFVNIYIAFSWDIWWYGGSFGQRAMIQGYAVLLFPLAAFIRHISKSKLKTILIGALSVFFVWLNLMQTYQAHFNGLLHPEFMTKAYYWRIFGKTNKRHSDTKLLDTKEDYYAEIKNSKVIFYRDFEEGIDSNFISSKVVKSGTKALIINEKKQYTPNFIIKEKLTPKTWVRVSANLYTPQKEHNIWEMSQMTISFEKEGKKIKTAMIRVHRFLPSKQWVRVYLDSTVPKKSYDTIKVYFWNSNGKKTLYIDDLKVENFTGGWLEK